MVALTNTPMRLNPSSSTIETGVYMIRNRVNGKMYVGSAAKSILLRWNMHRHQLRKKIHHSRLLQRAWNKHGEAAFEFIVICRCNPSWCLVLEQIHLNRLMSFDSARGYNVLAVAGSSLGSKRTAEDVARNSARQIGKKMSEESRQKMRDSMKRRMADPFQRERVMAAMAKGRTPEVIARGYAKKKLYWENPNPEHVAKLNAWRNSPELAARLKAMAQKQSLNGHD